MIDKTKKKKKKRRKKSLVGRFFKIVFLILIIYFISVIILLFKAYSNEDRPKGGGIINDIVEKVKPSLPERTTALIAVTDKGNGRTDGMMLVTYNSISNEVSVVSLPRDLKVDIPPDMWEVMVNNYKGLRGTDPSFQKLNHIPNFGNERGMEFLQRYIESFLKIQIDYYVHLDLEGFRYIVDSVGGIQFDVPQNMYYSDPTQDLLINLKKGEQLLDGEKAEELLRFRSYTMGDLQRIKVQQEFIKAFANKVVNIKSIMSNPQKYYTALKEYVDTNVEISDILKYIGEAPKIKIDNINTYTLPGTPKNIGGVSFVIADDSEVQAFVYELYRKPTVRKEDIVYEDSKDKSITVLNGSMKAGMAGDARDILTNNGYNVLDIGDSTYKKEEKTKIYVGKEGQGYDIEKYFTNSKVAVNPIMLNEIGDTDIVVIIGTKSEVLEYSGDENGTNIDDKGDKGDKKDEKSYEDSYDKNITVLNGGHTSGMAGKVKNLLESNGYFVQNIGDSTYEKQNTTKIYVNNKNIGKDIKKLFKNSEIEEDINKTKEYNCDILIVIGIDEKLL